MSLSKFIGYTCADENIAFTSCKQSDGNPGVCLGAGERLTACVLKVCVDGGTARASAGSRGASGAARARSRARRPRRWASPDRRSRPASSAAGIATPRRRARRRTRSTGSACSGSRTAFRSAGRCRRRWRSAGTRTWLHCPSRRRARVRASRWPSHVATLWPVPQPGPALVCARVATPPRTREWPHSHTHAHRHTVRNMAAHSERMSKGSSSASALATSSSSR